MQTAVKQPRKPQSASRTRVATAARAVNDAGPAVLCKLIGALAVQPNASFGHVVEIVECVVDPQPAVTPALWSVAPALRHPEKKLVEAA